MSYGKRHNVSWLKRMQFAERQENKYRDIVNGLRDKNIFAAIGSFIALRIKKKI